MSRYNTQSKHKGFVLYSKVKYIRNAAKQPFYRLADAKRGAECLTRLDSLLSGNGFRQEKTAGGVNTHIISLLEKGFIERDIVYTQKPRAIYLNEPCSLVVSIGGENLITISSIISGLSVEEALNTASGAEELIDREVDFAYSESIGYLSPFIHDSGSGLCFSAALYLPSLKLRGECELHAGIRSFGMSLSPMFCGEENFGDIYILSYTPHYLADERQAAGFFSSALSAISENEAAAISSHFKGKESAVINTARRAVGALSFSESISESELFDYISDIRLCRCLVKDAPEVLPDISALNYLSAEGLNCSVIVSAKEKCTDQAECDRARALLTKAYIEHLKEVKNAK